MYGCPNCNNVFEPAVYGTRGGEPFIKCPECGMNRALNSEVWEKDAKAIKMQVPLTPEPEKKAKKVPVEKPKKSTKKKTKKK